MKTKNDAAQAVKYLSDFIGVSQLAVMVDAIGGEEGQFFIDKLCEMAERIQAMPKTYETDGQGDAAVVYLHYFLADCDWYITERDQEEDQHQAFGLACISEREFGYVSLVEILHMGAELDLHFSPVVLDELNKTFA